jgi:hypothetical protein
MPGDFSQLMSCSVGGADLQLLKYGLKEDPIVSQTAGRTGTKIAIQADGEILGTDAADFNAKLSAVIDSLGSSGQTITITGLTGATEVSLPYGDCLNGGPHIAWEFLPDQDTAFHKRIRFTASAEVGYGPDPKGGSPTDHYSETVETRPDGLRKVTRDGELTAPAGFAAGALSYFDNTALPAFRSLYKLPDWIVSHTRQVSDNITSTKVSYKLEAVELYDALPAGQGVTSVSGNATTLVERDEQMRKLTTKEYDLVVDGDPIQLMTFLRQMLQGKTVLSESYDTEDIAENRVRCRYKILEGGNGNDLLNWKQELDVTPEGTPHQSFEYPLGKPAIVLAPAPTYRVTQRGSAIGAGRYPRPPEKMYDGSGDGVIGEMGSENYTPLNEVEKQTTWSYTFIFASHPTLDGSILARLERPDDPHFFN